MKYNIVIFDLDGTILNTIDDLADSVNEILKKYNFPVHTTREIQYMVGNGIPKLIERAVPQSTSKEIQEKVLKDFIAWYENHSAIKTRPYEKMTEVLLNLKKDGIKLAVNSNKLHEASVDLCQKYFPSIFDWVCGAKPENKTKPSPDGVNEILEKAGFSKDKVVFIGDSDVDFLTSQNVPCDFIGAAWGFRGEQFLREKGAQIIAHTPEDLLSLLQITGN